MATLSRAATGTVVAVIARGPRRRRKGASGRRAGLPASSCLFRLLVVRRRIPLRRAGLPSTLSILREVGTNPCVSCVGFVPRLVILIRLFGKADARRDGVCAELLNTNFRRGGSLLHRLRGLGGLADLTLINDLSQLFGLVLERRQC